jgi:hypothetical protein
MGLVGECATSAASLHCGIPSIAQSDMLSRDTTGRRARAIRKFEELDLPLYEAARRSDGATIKALLPGVTARRIALMIAMSRAFQSLEAGWQGDTFHTIVFDDGWSMWRRDMVFSGPISTEPCAICGRPSVYRQRDTVFCRGHGLDDLASGIPHGGFAAVLRSTQAKPSFDSVPNATALSVLPALRRVTEIPKNHHGGAQR